MSPNRVTCIKLTREMRALRLNSGEKREMAIKDTNLKKKVRFLRNFNGLFGLKEKKWRVEESRRKLDKNRLILVQIYFTIRYSSSLPSIQTDSTIPQISNSLYYSSVTDESDKLFLQ